MRQPDESALTGFGFLAEGVVGHHVPVHVAPGPEQAWTDVRAIHISDTPDIDPWLTVLVQAALIRAGSFDPAIMLRLVGRPALTRRYLVCEARRALTLSADRLPRRLLNHPDLVALPATSGSAKQSLLFAQGTEEFPEPGLLLGVMRPGAALRNAAQEVVTGTASGTGSGEPKARQEPKLDEDEQAEGSKILDKFSSPLGGGGPLADLFKRLIGMGTQRGADSTMASGAGEDSADGSGRTVNRKRTLQSNGIRATERDAAVQERTTAARYPEWDVHAARYRPGHVHVAEFVPWEEERTKAMAQALGDPSAEMRRQVMRLGLGYERHRRQAMGDEIVVDELVKLVADARAGHTGDQRIYRGLRKTRRDLGVLVLIDCSASTADATPAGGTILDRQMALGWELAVALDAAGDRVALYGFNSWGRGRVHMLGVKGLDDRIGSETRRRLALLPPVGFTRIGAALRHAAHVVRDGSGMPFKLVVLITDGLSYDDGYESGYGEADTRKAIAELQTEHIGTLCLSVGGEADDRKLRRVFGSAAFLRADEPAAMTRQLGGLLGMAMARVAHR